MLFILLNRRTTDNVLNIGQPIYRSPRPILVAAKGSEIILAIG